MQNVKTRKNDTLIPNIFVDSNGSLLQGQMGSSFASSGKWEKLLKRSITEQARDKNMTAADWPAGRQGQKERERAGDTRNLFLLPSLP